MESLQASALRYEDELRREVGERVSSLLKPITEVLSDSLGDESCETVLTKIRTALNAALSLVSGSQDEAGDFQSSIDEWIERESTGGMRVSWQRLGPWPDWSVQERQDALRILYEACRNARRHGLADEIRVLLRAWEGGYSFTVEDNGCGFPDDQIQPTGAGLGTMSLRAERSGARFFLSNRPEGGALIGWSSGLEEAENALEAKSGICDNEDPAVGKRLGMELHDDLCQRLGVIPMDLELLQEQLPPECSQDWLRLKEAEERLREAHDQIRKWSHQLIETNALSG